MQEFIVNNKELVIFLIVAWTLPWTAVALWKSARRSEMAWFIVLLLTSSLGILEIIYIFVVCRNKSKIDTLN